MEQSQRQRWQSLFALTSEQIAEKEAARIAKVAAGPYALKVDPNRLAPNHPLRPSKFELVNGYKREDAPTS